MSGYRYDYPLARAPRSPWRSAFTTIAAAATIAIVSGIGGAAVVLELVAPPKGPADAARMSGRERAALSTTVPQSEARNDSKIADESKTGRDAGNRPVRVIANGSPAPAAPDEKAARSSMTTAVAPPPAPAVAAQPLAPVAPPPVAAVAAQAAPAQSNPPAEMSASDLTFSKGYAKRRAAREAAMKAAGLEPRKEDLKKGDATEAKESKDTRESKEARKAEKVARAKHRGTTETAYDLPDGRRVTVYRNYRSDRGEYNDRSERYNDRYNNRYAERFERRETFGFGDDFQRPTRRGMFGDFF